MIVEWDEFQFRNVNMVVASRLRRVVVAVSFIPLVDRHDPIFPEGLYPSSPQARVSQ
jgi:hypothetical protein